MDAAVVQDAAAAQFGRADAELKERSAPDVIVVENLHQASHLIRSRRSGSIELRTPDKTPLRLSFSPCVSGTPDRI
jgi:hypothetical protein